MTGNPALMDLEAAINAHAERAPETYYRCYCGHCYIDPERPCYACGRAGPHIPFTEPIKQLEEVKR